MRKIIQTSRVDVNKRGPSLRRSFAGRANSDTLQVNLTITLHKVINTVRVDLASQ